MSLSFMPEPSVPERCPCDHKATWLVYNKTVKRDQYYCDMCVPPVGKPRIKRLRHSPDGFWYSPAPPEGTIN